MILSKNDLRDYIEEDYRANRFDESKLKILNPLFWYLVSLRKLEYYHNTKKSRIKLVLWTLIHKHYSIKTGISIGLNVFGKGLYIPHYGCIVINNSARFGNNCIVQCGVNVSENVRGGDNIFLGAGCKLMIDTSVAENTIVGANAVVTKQFFEPNIVLAGIPAKKISNRGMASNRKSV